MCLVVPLMPAYLFEEAEKVLRDVVDTTWLRYSKHVSVYECESLTTDSAESFHRHNKIKLGGRHPCIWTLSDGIEKILIDEEINYKRLLTTAKPPKRRTPQYVIDRLKMMPKSIQELLFILKLIIGNDIDFITNDDSVPHEFDIPFFPTQSSASKCEVSQSSKIPTKFSNPSLKNKEKAVKNSPLFSPKSTQVMTISGTKNKNPSSSTVTSYSLKIPQKPGNTILKKIKPLTAAPLVLPKSNEILMSSVTNNRKRPSSTVTILKKNKPLINTPLVLPKSNQLLTSGTNNKKISSTITSPSSTIPLKPVNTLLQQNQVMISKFFASGITYWKT